MSHKLDLNTERTPKQWQVLLDTVKVNSDNILTKDEQSFYIEQIEYKLGIKSKHTEALKMIEEQSPDYSDLV